MNTRIKKIGIGVLAVSLTAICAILGFLLSSPREVNTEATTQALVTEIEIKALPKGQKIAVPTPVRSTMVFLSESGADISSLMRKIAETGFNSVVLADTRQTEDFTVSDTCGDPLKSAVSAARDNGLYCAVCVKSDDAEQTAAFLADSGADCGILPSEDNLSSLDEQLAQTAVGSLLVRTTLNTSSLLPETEHLRSGAFVNVPADTTGDMVYACKSVSEDNALRWFAVPMSASKDKSGYDRLSDSFSALSSVMETDGTKPDTSFVFAPFADFAQDEECTRIVKAALTTHMDPKSFQKKFRVINHNQATFSTAESKVTFTGECSPMYPLLCNNTPVEVTSDGYFSKEFDLKVGSNTFTFTNNGKQTAYTVQYAPDLIRSISPSGTLTTPGGNALEISVVAHRKASVYATLNGSRITLTSADALLGEGIDTTSDYVTYLGKYNLPESAASTLTLGSIKAFASYSGMSDSITGATVTITAAEKIEALPVIEEPKTTTTTAKTTTTTTTTTLPLTTEAEVSESESDVSGSEQNSESEGKTSTTKPTTTETSPTETTTASTTSTLKLDPVITPYKNHGLPGTKRMCVIKTYYTETMPLSPLNDLSVPLSTPLLQGTFDFITGESSFDKYTYYNLGSGRRVYRKDVEVIEKAYAMPANTITLVNSGTYSGSTDINLHVKWKVPFNVVMNGQRYINDPKNKREYAVTALNANSLDITFYYTAEVSGQPNVSGSGVISSCEWVQSASAQTYTLRLHLRNASRFYGYSYSYNADDTLCIRIKERASAGVSGKTVMLDPGHGGADGGATCAVNSSTYNEAKINLALSEKVRAKLQNMGANVLMTRTANTNVTLDARKQMARQNRPDIFVSIHCDASTSSSAYGTTGFYYRNYSQALAKNIHQNLVNAYVNTIYGTRKDTIDRGTVFYPFSVTRIEECPSVLIECGYVTNLSECKILQNSVYQDTIASAIANGIRDYFSQS